MTNSKTIDPEAKPRAILYDAAGHDRGVDLQNIKIEELGNEQLLWIDVAGTRAAVLPAEMRAPRAELVGEGDRPHHPLGIALH